MKPIEFPQQNTFIAKDQPEYNTLPAHYAADGTVTTCWQLSNKEINELMMSQKLYLSVKTFGDPLQPVFITVYNQEVLGDMYHEKPNESQNQNETEAKSNPEESQNKPNPLSGINEYELNGKLLEISLILGCDVLELIEIKNQIIKKGRMDVHDKFQLRKRGFPIANESFFDSINQIIQNEPITTNGYIETYGFQHQKKQKENKYQEKENPKRYKIDSFERLINVISTENVENLSIDLSQWLTSYAFLIKEVRERHPETSNGKQNWDVCASEFVWIDDEKTDFKGFTTIVKETGEEVTIVEKNKSHE